MRNKVLYNTVQLVRYINARKNFAHAVKTRNLAFFWHTHSIPDRPSYTRQHCGAQIRNQLCCPFAGNSDVSFFT